VTSLQKENTHRSLAGSSLFIFAARFFPALANVLIFSYYSHKLSVGAYGQYQNFWIQLLTLSALACMGIHAFAMTYTPAFLIRIFKSLSAKHLLVFSLVSTFSALGFGLLQQHYNGMQLGLPVLFFLVYVPAVVSEALLLVAKAFRPLTVINLLFSAVFCFLHWQSYREGYRLDTLIWYLLALTVLRLLMNVYCLRKVYRLHLPAAMEDTTPIEWKSTWSLWLHLGIHDVIQVLFRWADKFILSLVIAEDLLAVYFNATVDIPFLSLVFLAVNSAALMHWAQIRQKAGTSDITEQHVQLLFYSSRILSSVMFPLFAFLVFFRTEFLGVIFSSKYETGATIFLISLFIIPLRAYPFTGILQNYHKGKEINIGAAFDLVAAVLLMYPLYHWMGLEGVALAFIISTYLQGIYYIYHISKVLKRSPWQVMPYRYLLVKMGICCLFFGGLYYLLSLFHLSKPAMLLAGLGTLGLSGAVALYYEWKKSSK
jgi:O-antigen/teichoic acid export membrane protein